MMLVSMANLAVEYINLRKSKVASSNLAKVSSSDVALLTEPYVYKNRVACLGRGRTLFQATDTSPRACVWAKSSLNFWQVDEFTTRDVCTVAMELKNKVVYLAAVYLDVLTPVCEDTMVNLVRSCSRNEIPLLLCMDSNAHSPLWNCADSNQRGEELEEFFLEEGLTVLNVGNVPTYCSSIGSSIIDVTVVNTCGFNALEVEDWRVLPDETFSDHRYIQFGLRLGSSAPAELRCWKKGRWGELAE